MPIWAGCGNSPAASAKPGETFEQCLARELQEELGVKISVGELFEEISHRYAEKTVRLKFFVCHLPGGEPQPLGCAAVRWIGKAANWLISNFPPPTRVC